MYDQPGVDSTTVVNQNGNFMPDLNAPGSIEQGLVGPFVKMPLYDVGMSALLVSEAQALAELAVLLGRNDTAAMLAKRCVDMRALMQAHLWNDQLGIYSNKFSGNNSFYPRISPTSFFPVFARSPSCLPCMFACLPALYCTWVATLCHRCPFLCHCYRHPAGAASEGGVDK